MLLTIDIVHLALGEWSSLLTQSFHMYSPIYLNSAALLTWCFVMRQRYIPLTPDLSDTAGIYVPILILDRWSPLQMNNTTVWEEKNSAHCFSSIFLEKKKLNQLRNSFTVPF